MPQVPKDRDVPLGSGELYLQNQRYHNQDRTLIIGAGKTVVVALISCGNEFHRLTRCLLHKAVLHVLWQQRAGLYSAQGQPCCMCCLQLLSSSGPKQQVLVLQVVFAAAVLHREVPVG